MVVAIAAATPIPVAATPRRTRPKLTRHWEHLVARAGEEPGVLADPQQGETPGPGFA